VTEPKAKSKVTSGEIPPPEPDLVEPKPKKGRPPGSKTDPARAAETAKKKAKARVNFGPFLAMPVPPPGGPGGELRSDPMRDTFGKVAALALPDGVSKAVAYFDRKAARKAHRPPRAELGTFYPKTGLAMIQAMFDQVVPLIDFGIHPVWGLCICYFGTIVVAAALYMAQDERDADGDIGREGGGGAGGPPKRRGPPDSPGGGPARDGQDNVSAPLLREAGTEAPVS